MRNRYVHLLAVGLLLLGGAWVARAAEGVGSPGADAAAPAPGARDAAVVSLDGRVDDFNRDRLIRRFDEARRLGAKTVILKLNTPGGLVTSALDISRFLKQQDDLHVIAFVDEKAYSAGAMIALAADEVVMEPGSYLGDAAPIVVGVGGGVQTLGETERAKAASPILADFHDSAVKNGHEPLLAEAMVTAGRVVHWVEHPETKQRRFVSAEQFKALSAEGWREVNEPGVPVPLDSADTLFTVSADVATKIGLASGMAPSAEALAANRGLNLVADLTPTGGERFVEALSSPAARFILFVAFLISMYVAMHLPGTGLPEAAALTALGLLVGIPLLTGYAQWWEVVLVVVGIALLALELFVIPGFGVAGIAGILLMLVGLLLTFVGNVPGVPGSWNTPAVRTGLLTGVSTIVGGIACSLVLSLWLRRYLPRVPYFNRLVLSTVSGAPKPAAAAVFGPASEASADAWPFVGTVGRAVTDLRPGGTAEFPFGDDSRTASVVTEAGFVSAGTKLAVLEVRGSRIVVKPV